MFNEIKGRNSIGSTPLYDVNLTVIIGTFYLFVNQIKIQKERLMI
jgi:hypothetical protein